MERDPRIRELSRKIVALAPRLPYHNLDHLEDVSTAAERYAIMEKLGPPQVLALKLAGLLHDIIYVPGKSDNEERSAVSGMDLLRLSGFSTEEVDTVPRLIIATKLPTNPGDIMEKIICDADLDVVGRRDFLEKAELLRRELGLDKRTWYAKEANFISNIKFYTNSAKRLRGKKLQENLQLLRRLEC